jgi:hypothetical protein
MANICLRSLKQQQIQTECHSHRFGRVRSQRPVNRKQDVLNGGSVQIGRGGGAAPVGKSEALGECRDGSRHPITAGAAQFDEILGRGKGDEEASSVAQYTPEFARIHPRCYRKDDRERSVGVGYEAIGIGHDPLASRVAPRGGIDGRNRDVDAVRVEARLAFEGTKVEAVTATGVENDIARTHGYHLRDRVEQRLGHTAIVQSPPRCHGGRRVAWLPRSPVLRLKQVGVSAARDVERMSARTEPAPLLLCQRHMAVADGTEKHVVECTG